LRYANRVPTVVKLIPRRGGLWVEVAPDSGPNLRLPRAQLPSWVNVDAQATDAQWMQLGALARFCGLYDRALALLSRREHFAAELARKLSQREPDRALVRQVLARCHEQGYLDDARAAAATVQGLIAAGGCGRARLKAELFKRGCPKALMDSALAEHAGELDEAAEVKELLRRKRNVLAAKAQSLRAKLEAKGMAGVQLTRELERRLGETVVRFLLARGFGGEAVYGAARELVREIAGDG
jgi:SOS response regulatory protein OraA/RecX